MICQATSAEQSAAMAKRTGLTVVIFSSLDKAPLTAMPYTTNGTTIITPKPNVFNFMVNGRGASGSFMRKAINAMYSRNKPAPYTITSIINKSSSDHTIIILTTTAQMIIER